MYYTHTLFYYKTNVYKIHKITNKYNVPHPYYLIYPKKKKKETSILSHYDLFDGIMIHYVHQMDKHLRK